jgi:hypothetical protein
MTRTQADHHLRRFLEGSATAEKLAQILATPLDHSAGVTFEPPTSPPLHVAPAHLVRVCDAILAGGCEPRILRDVGFLLIGSDAFEYDGDAQDGARVAKVAADWSAPEINWPLTLENVQEWRLFLGTGEAPTLRAG